MRAAAALLVSWCFVQEPVPDPVGFVAHREIRLLRLDATHGYWHVCVWVRCGRFGVCVPYFTLWRAEMVGSCNADLAVRQSRQLATLEVRGLLGYAAPPPGWHEADLAAAWCFGAERLAQLQQMACGPPERVQ